MLEKYSDREFEEIQNSLRFVHTTSERIVRVLGSDLLNAIPFRVYRPVTTLIKKTLGLTGLIQQG